MHVLDGLFQPKHGALFTMELFGLLNTAVSAPGLNPRVFETHAGGAGTHLRVALNARTLRDPARGQRGGGEKDLSAWQTSV
jgi:hypothetical protein